MKKGTTKMNTNRRDFIKKLGLGAAAATIPIASTASTNKTKKDTWEDVAVGQRLGLGYAISGYLACQAYEDMTDEKLKEIELTISRMFYEFETRELLFDKKVIASVQDNKLKVKIGFKKQPGINFTIWDFSVECGCSSNVGFTYG